MTLLNWMGLISTIVLFIPIALLLICGLAWYRSLPALLFYYLFVFAYNLITLSYGMGSNEAVPLYYRIGNHLLEVPAMLLFFTYFSTTVSFRKNLISATLIFMVFEVVIVAVYGFTGKAITIIRAPGLLMILALSGLFFFHQVKIAVIYHKAIGKAIMIASLLFAYAGYTFVYIVESIFSNAYNKDAYLIYCLVTIVTSIPMAVGIMFERKRVQQLSELQVTREELKKIYGESGTETSIPFGTVALNYDKDQWN
ncbi:MAG: hypothetical protein ABI480_04090 [Chitinophagaceae bacterium]